MIDDDEFEYWFNASESEIAREEARINAELVELERRLAKLPIARQVAYHRRNALQSILKNRHRLRTHNTIECINEMWREHIRHRQLELVKLRVWRSTGVYPGSA